MDLAILDPFNTVLPQYMESTCMNRDGSLGNIVIGEFSRTGTWFATGTDEGFCTVWDMATANWIAHSPEPLGRGSVVSLSWNPRGGSILVAWHDGSVGEWDLAGHRYSRSLCAPAEPGGHVRAWFHPSMERVWIVCQRQGLLLYLADEQVELGRSPGESSAAVAAAAMDVLNRTLLVHYAAKGGLSVYDIDSLAPLAQLSELDGITSPILHIVPHPRKQQEMLVCFKDRVIRSFSIADRATFRVRNRFLDPVNRCAWCSVGYSHDGEIVYGGVGSKGQTQQVYIWDGNTAALIKMLEGARENLVQVAWNPRRPMICGVTAFGSVVRWTARFAPKWSALVPGVEEIEENVEYVEREDEFDLTAEEEANARNSLDRKEADGPIDIVENGPIAPGDRADYQLFVGLRPNPPPGQ